MTSYTETILRYAADDRRAGILAGADGTGEVGLQGQEAGTRLAVRFTLKAPNGVANAVRFQVFGCGFTMACCAAAAELAEGRSLEDVLKISPEAVDTALDGLPEERGYCSRLAVEALHAAVQSAQTGTRSVEATLPGAAPEEDHGHRIDKSHPVYRTLMDSPAPKDIIEPVRHLFACLIAVAAEEPHAIPQALGLSPGSFESLLERIFPAVDPSRLDSLSIPATKPPPEINREVLEILLGHVPQSAKDREPHWLAHCLAARAAHPGHLWTAMGLFERPQLTASIRLLLPSLAEANNRGMRWKRYLFKQVCDLHGTLLCKSPNCGSCSDYALCFAPEEE